MTVQELYGRIGGSYENALKVMMNDMIIGKMIVKYLNDPGCEKLKAAAADLDPRQMFEAAHALKGASGNLALTDILALTSVLSDEFRPGHARTMTDEQVRAMVDEVIRLDEKVRTDIRAFAG